MGFVKEENQLRLVEVARLGKLFKQLGEQPEQERRVEFGVLDKPVSSEQIEHALAARRLHKIVELHGRLAKKESTALLFELQQPALDRSDGRGGYISIF